MVGEAGSRAQAWCALFACRLEGATPLLEMERRVVTRLVVPVLSLVGTVEESSWLVLTETLYFCSLEPSSVTGSGCVHEL